jgi:nucleotide-binding universal stress UspA family protein
LGLNLTFCLAPLLSALTQGAGGDEWPRIWSLCQAVRGDAAVISRLSECLEDADSGVREEVASFHLLRAQGGHPELVNCVSLPSLEEGAAWAFSLALSPGEALDAALCLALDEGPPDAMAPVLKRGYERFMLHSSAASGAQAVSLAEALHRRARAVWSGMNLAISRTRAGDYVGASETLSELLKGELSDADLAVMRSRLSLVYFGRGGLVMARGHLGAGLTQGSGDSGIVLGLIAIEGGHWGRSRVLFRSALARDPRQAWAGRGWGLSMVPRTQRLTN